MTTPTRPTWPSGTRRRTMPGRSLGPIVTALISVAIALGSTFWVSAQPPAGGAPAGMMGAPGSDDGKTIYEARCANCHGLAGKGDGAAAALLRVQPRDFTTGRYKLRSTESGNLPTDADLIKTIKSGMHGSAMPDWAPFLPDVQIEAVAAYLKTFSPRFAAEQVQLVPMTDPVAATPESISAGREVFDRLKCASCHGTDGTGRNALTTDLKDDWGRPTLAARLNEPWTFRGGATATDIYLRLRTGMNGTPMPSFHESASDTELWHLANFVVSMARKPVWEMTAAETEAYYSTLAEQERADKTGRGKYLLTTLGCAYCHSPINADSTSMPGLTLAGGQRLSLYPFTNVVSYNLTSDRDTGLGAWTDDQIKNVLTKGIRPDGSRMLPFPMPWTSYGSMKPEDLDALIAALREVPPVSNAIPPPTDLSLIPYLWGKFQVLILQRDIPGLAYPGNAGTPQGKSWQTAAR